MAEHEKRKRARALLTKSGYAMGGHLSKRADEIADKHEITEAVHEHEGNMHPGKKKTRLRLRDGGAAEGMMAHSRSDRKPRGAKAKGKGHTTVNVVVAGQHPKPQPVPVPVPVPPDGGGGPMPPPSVGGAPPPGMPMGAKRGGKTYKKGGAVKATRKRYAVGGPVAGMAPNAVSPAGVVPTAVNAGSVGQMPGGVDGPMVTAQNPNMQQPWMQNFEQNHPGMQGGTWPPTQGSGNGWMGNRFGNPNAGGGPGLRPNGPNVGAPVATPGMNPATGYPPITPLAVASHKRGGTVKGPDFEGGAGGGLGRLEKAEEYGAKVKRGGTAR